MLAEVILVDLTAFSLGGSLIRSPCEGLQAAASKPAADACPGRQCEATTENGVWWMDDEPQLADTIKHEAILKDYCGTAFEITETFEQVNP